MHSTKSILSKSILLTSFSIAAMSGCWYWKEYIAKNHYHRELDSLYDEIKIKESKLSKYAKNEFSQKSELVQEENVLKYILRQCRLSFWIPLENHNNNNENNQFAGYLAFPPKKSLVYDKDDSSSFQLIYLSNTDLLSKLMISLRNSNLITSYNDSIKLLFTPKPAIMNICYVEGDSEDEFLNRLCDSFHLSRVFIKRFQNPLHDTLNWIVDVLRTANSEIELSEAFKLQSTILNQLGYSHPITMHLLVEWRKSKKHLITESDKIKWIKILGNIAHQISDFSQVTFCMSKSDDITSVDSQSFLNDVESIWSSILNQKGKFKILNDTYQNDYIYSIISWTRYQRDKLLSRLWKIYDEWI